MANKDTFRSWAKPPSESERLRCENAERAIAIALNKNEKLAKKNILVFAQGSYKNNTYITLDSDVDICIMLRDTFYTKYPEGHTAKMYGNTSSDFTFKEFKNMVGEALVNHFGKEQVSRGNKAFDVHANSYRVDADVVPAFEHRRYTGSIGADKSHHYHKGIELRPDNGGSIINWPDQTHQNGISKNNNTARRYKAAIRILKRLRGKMQDDGVKEANDVASFLISSLVWNVPDGYFGNADYSDDIRAVLAHTFVATMKEEESKEWGEVNELKYLFRDGKQPWTRKQAHDFLAAAWDYVGFK